MAHLILESEDGRQRDIPIEADEVSLGRSSVNDVVIDDPAASSHHCVIVRRENRYTLRDLGSTNGTFVNGSAVSEVGLAAGDVFNVGAMRITLQGDDIAAPVDATPPATVVVSPTAGQPPEFGLRRSRSGLWITVGVLIGLGLAVLLWLFIDGLFLK